jgi:predicted glycosyltransferase involved in capsule biosynthesis
MDFTYIIAYRHSEERFNNIQLVLKWIGDSAKEIILVESDVEPKLDSLKKSFDFKHIFLKNNYPFNKSWCFNVGYKSSSTENIVFGDADLIMNKQRFLEAVSKLTENDVVNPYRPVLDLTFEESQRYANTSDFSVLESIVRPGRGETDHQKVPFCGGIIMFKKETLNRIGGWNEDFWGWGCEDDAQSFKVFTLDLKHSQCENKCYHLYHMRPAPNQELYFRNFNIYTQFVQLDKPTLEKYVSSIDNRFGDPKKLENIQ